MTLEVITEIKWELGRLIEMREKLKLAGIELDFSDSRRLDALRERLDRQLGFVHSAASQELRVKELLDDAKRASLEEVSKCQES